ncbi:reticulon-4-interacting protein 1, mitochondrial [Belonocnema kinseyi]|uniref:reticulon-4-interacting protein 1, mitochondrial n=1 Tax=Belonocnema kinseyi TaxID=2817044 RepID=UPI00143CC6AD|nr:reticulon-4-interacting protein 1, mitochondrial [Belonocnema kinseyi]
MLKGSLEMLRPIIPRHFRSLSKVAVKHKERLDDKMQAWQIHSYGGLEELKLCTTRMPVITRPSDVLIKVDASSVNPFDLSLTRGYGSKVLNFMRKAKNLGAESDIEFPLTLGRDFAGTVVSKGHGVGGRLKLGEEVWGVVPVEQQGCHAEYVIANESLVNPRPRNISCIEAASIPYAGLTAWSALWLSGGLCYKTAVATRRNKRVLVLGGSGGVGTLAIQMLKAWNMHVITTCSSDAVNVLEKIGADVVIDYKEDRADEKLVCEGPYDIILDCANQGPDVIKAKGYPHYTYITLNSPLLKNIDERGFISGTVKNVGDFVKYNFPSKENKGFVKWGFFAPSKTGLDALQKFVENGQLVSVVKKVYPFQELPRAYERIAQGHLRGKLVVDMN